jgi:rRNA maturation endonuclease Nob1
MTKYICKGCGSIYDDDEGMPVRCCGKIIRHIFEVENGRNNN